MKRFDQLPLTTSHAILLLKAHRGGMWLFLTCRSYGAFHLHPGCCCYEQIAPMGLAAGEKTMMHDSQKVHNSQRAHDNQGYMIVREYMIVKKVLHQRLKTGRPIIFLNCIQLMIDEHFGALLKGAGCNDVYHIHTAGN